MKRGVMPSAQPTWWPSLRPNRIPNGSEWKMGKPITEPARPPAQTVRDHARSDMDRRSTEPRVLPLAVRRRLGKVSQRTVGHTTVTDVTNPHGTRTSRHFCNRHRRHLVTVAKTPRNADGRRFCDGCDGCKGGFFSERGLLREEEAQDGY